MSDSGARDEDDRGPPSAAEYVLGVLSAHERRAVEQRIAREPAFAREVAFWEERLGGLAEGIAPVRPPASAWARIEAALGSDASATERDRSLAKSRLLARACVRRQRARRGLPCGADLCRDGHRHRARRWWRNSMPKAARPASSPRSAQAAEISLSCRLRCLVRRSRRRWSFGSFHRASKPHSLGLIDPESAGDDHRAQRPARQGQ